MPTVTSLLHQTCSSNKYVSASSTSFCQCLSSCTDATHWHGNLLPYGQLHRDNQTESCQGGKQPMFCNLCKLLSSMRICSSKACSAKRGWQACHLGEGSQANSSCISNLEEHNACPEHPLWTQAYTEGLNVSLHTHIALLTYPYGLQ